MTPQRAEFVDTVAGHLRRGVKAEVLLNAFDCWKKSTATPASRSRRRSAGPVHSGGLSR